MVAKFGMNFLEYEASPTNCLTSVTDLGSGQSFTDWFLAGSVAIPCSDTSWPRKATFLHSRLHFLGLSLRLILFSLSITGLMFTKRSSKV